jgi:hypothetical protein
MTAMVTPEKQLAGFIAKFSPERARQIRDARKKMRALVPNATEMVYDNYNFFVIGYGPNEKASLAIFSIAAQASGVSLCFLQGAGLPDPTRRLRGSGNVVRNLRLEGTATLDEPDVRALIDVALARAKVRIEPDAKHRLIIKSVSAKQRPRQKPATKREPRTRTKAKPGRKRRRPAQARSSSAPATRPRA